MFGKMLQNKGLIALGSRGGVVYAEKTISSL